MYKLIKHRGVHNETIKENTYDAVKLALLDEKYVGVEFDVRETKDNEFILFHNPLLNGKLISEYLYNELPKYIPRLKDILKIDSNKIFLIEIKSIQSISKFINLLNKYENKKIYVMSFSNNMIDKINKESRKYKIGILNYVLNTDNQIYNLDFVAILNSLINEKIMQNLKNLEIFSYGLFENFKYKNVYYIVDS